MMRYWKLLGVASATILASFGAEHAQAQTTVGSSTLSCGTATQQAGGTPNGLITADTPTSDGLRVFQNNTPFKLAITTNAPNADTVVWSIADSNGAIKTQGSFPVNAGVQTNTISCTSTWSGYGALTATL
ncbi:hypothetical protein GCT13_42355, partial [Paraburkholderia sp. CNPSo 3157]|nr:hypothetical protein [Paraburkholderia franconis]